MDLIPTYSTRRIDVRHGEPDFLKLVSGVQISQLIGHDIGCKPKPEGVCSVFRLISPAMRD